MSSALIIKSFMQKEKIDLSKPEENKEDFWQIVVDDIAAKYFSQYAYPTNYYSELLKIKEYCQRNKIELIVWLPPNHVDYQKRIEDFGLVTEYKKFKSDMGMFDVLYDYTERKDIILNKDNFSDPMHFTKAVGDRIINELGI